MSIIRISVPEYLNALLLSVLIVGFTATPAAAQFGPVIAGAGPINRSMGGAATAAPLSAGGALMWNAATLSGLEGSQIDVGAELLFPQASLSSSIPANTFGPGVPPIDLSGLSGRTRSADGVFALPTIALSHRPDGSPLTYGLGIFGVAGFGLNYPGSTTNPVLTAPAPNGLGFGPIFSQYQVMQIAPALVYDVNDQLSVSFSPLLDLGNLQLDPSVISAPNDANGDTLATYPAGMHSRQAWGLGSLSAHITRQMISGASVLHTKVLNGFSRTISIQPTNDPWHINHKQEFCRLDPLRSDREIRRPKMSSSNHMRR